MTEEEVRKIYPEYKPQKRQNRFIDRTGQVYGRLTVLYRTYNTPGKNSRWVCICSCGNYSVVNSSNLTGGNCKSCGCLLKEQGEILHKKYNEYDLTNEYGVGYLSNSNNRFLFDKEDFNIIKDYCWAENDQGYAVSHNENGSNIRMHRLIIKPKTNEIIDHKNLNRLDNRKENLRIANKQTNGINRPCNKNNKLGVKGVFYNKRYNKYVAKIMKDGKSIYLGSFQTLEEAHQARINKEREIYGEFAYE